MNLYQKIVEVRKVASGFTKDKQGFGYEYVSGNQILAKIKDKMNELNLLIVPSTKLGSHHTYDYVTDKGKEKTDFVVSGEMSYTWINGDKPEERLEVSWAYYGQQDDISKAYGSALTYSERYFLLKCLGLPTDEDDPDGKNTTGKKRADSSQPLSEKQINRLFAIAKKKGFTPEQVKKTILNDFSKTNVADLTREEYDNIVSRIEAK